jgi:hypothetical protein
MMMMMMFIGTETLVTMLSSGGGGVSGLLRKTVCSGTTSARHTLKVVCAKYFDAGRV